MREVRNYFRKIVSSIRGSSTCSRSAGLDRLWRILSTHGSRWTSSYCAVTMSLNKDSVPGYRLDCCPFYRNVSHEKARGSGFDDRLPGRRGWPVKAFVIIADDDPDVVKVLEHYLKGIGCRVSSALNKAELW